MGSNYTAKAETVQNRDVVRTGQLTGSNIKLTN